MKFSCILSVFEGHSGFSFLLRVIFFFFSLEPVFLFPPQWARSPVSIQVLQKLIRLTWENEFMLAWPLLHCHMHFKWPRGIICINKNELLIVSYNLIVEGWFHKFIFRKSFHLELQWAHLNILILVSNPTFGEGSSSCKSCHRTKGGKRRFKKVVYVCHMTLGLCYQKQGDTLNFTPGGSGNACSWYKPNEFVRV